MRPHVLIYSWFVMHANLSSWSTSLFPTLNKKKTSLFPPPPLSRSARRTSPSAHPRSKISGRRPPPTRLTAAYVVLYYTSLHTSRPSMTRAVHTTLRLEEFYQARRSGRVVTVSLVGSRSCSPARVPTCTASLSTAGLAVSGGPCQAGLRASGARPYPRLPLLQVLPSRRLPSRRTSAVREAHLGKPMRASLPTASIVTGNMCRVIELYSRNCAR